MLDFFIYFVIFGTFPASSKSSLTLASSIMNCLSVVLAAYNCDMREICCNFVSSVSLVSSDFAHCRSVSVMQLEIFLSLHIKALLLGHPFGCWTWELMIVGPLCIIYAALMLPASSLKLNMVAKLKIGLIILYYRFDEPLRIPFLLHFCFRVNTVWPLVLLCCSLCFWFWTCGMSWQCWQIWAGIFLWSLQTCLYMQSDSIDLSLLWRAMTGRTRGGFLTRYFFDKFIKRC